MKWYWLAGIPLLVAGLAWYVEAYKIERPYKQVVIEETANGYTIDLCEQYAPCPATRKHRKVALDAQGAAAEAWAYLSGPRFKPDWGR